MFSRYFTEIGTSWHLWQGPYQSGQRLTQPGANTTFQLQAMVSETSTGLCWQNTEVLLQFLPCSLAGHQPPRPSIHHLSTALKSLQLCLKDLFSYISPSVLSLTCGLGGIFTDHITNNSQPVVGYSFLILSSP